MRAPIGNNREYTNGRIEPPVNVYLGLHFYHLTILLLFNPLKCGIN